MRAEGGSNPQITQITQIMQIRQKRHGVPCPAARTVTACLPAGRDETQDDRQAWQDDSVFKGIPDRQV